MHYNGGMYIASGTNRPLSFRQKRAVDLWLSYGRKSKAKALREAGYASSVYRQPHKVFESPAVQDYLERGGFGRDGLHDNWRPEAKPIAVFHNPVDFSAVSTETLIKLKEQLGEIGHQPPLQEKLHLGTTPLTSQDW